MKVRQITITGEPEDNSQVVIEIDGNIEATFTDGELEDNSLGRNFADVYLISTFMRAAHMAGKHGEEFTAERVEMSWEEWENRNNV